MPFSLSINELALKIVEELIEREEELKIKVHKTISGTTVIDCGVKVKGSVEAGLLVTRVCLGGLGLADLVMSNYDGITLPSVKVSTDYPAIATIGSQMADWEINIDGYYALGSGPARALATGRPLPKPVAKRRELYEKRGYVISTPDEILECVGYKDESEIAIIVLESQKLPPENVLKYIAKSCNVKLKKLYALVSPVNSIVGSVQIAGRVVEVGLHKLGLLGFEFKRALHGSGIAPIPPLHPDPSVAMGLVNDSIRYAGMTFYVVDYDDERLKELVMKTPTSSSPRYGLSFYRIFKEARESFYGVDLAEFSPALITINNLRSGSTITAGEVKSKFIERILLMRKI